MSEARPGEEAAWAGVAARWGDEEAHREYLSRLWDLEGLAEAGRRYKAALDARRAIIAAALVVGVAMVGWVILKFPGARAP